MMREVGVHDDDRIARCVFQAVHVRRAQAQLPRARFQDDAGGAVEVLQLLGDFEGAVRGGVVDDDDLPV